MNTPEHLSFDTLIIGAGAAGCVLANRLSTDQSQRIALIEAGGSDRKFWVQVPLGYGKTFYDQSLNWGYHAEPDPGLAGRADYWPRGKILGGSTSLNAMVWMRGHRLDYEDWAKAGNPDWGFDACLPFFKEIEHNEAGADAYRAQSGDVFIADVSARLHPLAQRYIAAGREAGLPFNPDFNGAEQDGVGVYQLNTKDGWRMSAAKAFLRPVLNRKNLTLFTKAQATRILFEGQRASGIEMIKDGARLTLKARKRVILAAGAINSPQLLQLSGIGPAPLLKEMGIPLIQPMPMVGGMMQDHLGINYTYRSNVPSLNDTLGPWWGKLKAGLEFLLAGRGPLSLSLNQGGGFIRTRPGLDRPNIQLYFQAISTFTAKTGTRPLLGPDPFSGFSIGLSTCKPESRGAIRITSPDPLAKPRIIANAFGTPQDEQDMLEGVKMLRVLARQPALANVIIEELAPGPDVVSDDAIIADFKARSGTVYHPCGTARMGRNSDEAVVDQSLKVHGIAGLYVIDASVFPSVISGNTQAPVMMVAAKAAAKLLREEHAA